MQYKIYAALKQDTNEGLVWVSNGEIHSRSLVRITNVDTNKTIYCEALAIEHNYQKDYKNGWTNDLDKNVPLITMNAWYRNKLGIESTGDYRNLIVSKESHLNAKFRSCIGHPQIVVRLATWLGVISVFLGVFGAVK